MYAIIETGGKQYKVAPGDSIRVEKLAGADGEVVTFDRVILVNKDGNIQFGNPVVSGAKVTAKVVKQDKYAKILVFKYHSKTNYRRRYGHRQPYTQLVVENIEA